MSIKGRSEHQDETYRRIAEATQRHKDEVAAIRAAIEREVVEAVAAWLDKLADLERELGDDAGGNDTYRYYSHTAGAYRGIASDLRNGRWRS